MAFNAYSFVFDGMPSEAFGLMVFDFDGTSQSEGTFASGVTPIEDRLARSYRPLHYGVTQNMPLEFTLVFGASSFCGQRELKPFDRWDLEAIATWLTGHQQYKWLEIHQPDLEGLRFRCMVSELSIKSEGWLPWALSARVTCDSPFAYTFPEEYTYQGGDRLHHLYNRSTYSGYYYPKLEITANSGGDFSIINTTDGDRALTFTGLPSATALEISVDNQTGIITNSLGLNLYPYCNLDFLRLVRGDNMLQVAGDGEVKLVCEFPVNVGG